MSPPIFRSKLEQLAEFLESLEKFENISYEEFEDDQHYLIERLLELLVIYASDILAGILAQKKEEMPTTLRTVFLRAGELNILPAELAECLAQAAGMRNLLAHAYAKVDLRVIYDSIGPALRHFSEFVERMSQRNDVIEPRFE